jgi:flagellar motor component MotA
MEVYMHPIKVQHTIKLGTIVKVVVAGTIAAYVARNVVKVIDDSLAGFSTALKQEKEKEEQK